MNKCQWHHFKNAEMVAQAACEQILNLAQIAIQQRGVFRIVLAGGSTPQRTYELLSQQTADWEKWAVYFGDERCLPRGHVDRNSTMAHTSLLDKVAIKPSLIFDIPAELDADKAAELYSEVIQSAMPFDLVLLGMGEDGHIASIFPGHSWEIDASVYSINNSPKPPSKRITLSANSLGNAQKLLYLITGKSKQTAVSKWKNGEVLPVNSIPIALQCEVLIDEDAHFM